MSTRGLYAIRYNGVDKGTYNHSDSYPDWLGEKMLRFCANNSVEDLIKFFNRIELVEENSKPTEEQIKKCVEAGYYNEVVSTRSADDWYCLLRNLQGNFDEYQKLIDNDDDTTIFMTEGMSFIKDSLFCEYAYIINLDDEVLEFYEGFQKEPDPTNRYGQDEDREDWRTEVYYPCKLILTFPLDEIIEADIHTMVKQMETGIDNADDLESYEKLQEEFDLDEDDARAVVKAGKSDRVCGIYEDTYDVGHDWAVECIGIDNWLDNDRYVNFDKIGEDQVEDTDAWFELPSGKYAHLS